LRDFSKTKKKIDGNFDIVEFYSVVELELNGLKKS